MKTPGPQPRTREELTQELARNRRESMKATERGDFREVARLTREAASLNQAIAEMLPVEPPSY